VESIDTVQQYPENDVGGIVAAVLWAVIGLGAAWLSAQAGATEHVNVAFVEDAAVSAYTDRIIAALQKVGEGALDLTDDMTAIFWRSATRSQR
jgi:hypothetical protein